ncbi:periplasmic heavy metal sensor [Candidatus Aerophobetes bacterium]|nr:periplasmic heavy metal sensor [Candidatus Aerophobetes bacterium]
MKKRWGKRAWVVLLLVAFVISLASVSWAWRGNYGPRAAAMREGRERWERRVDIDLTLEQKETLAKLRLSLQEETLDLRTQLTRKRIELNKLWLEESPDKTRIYSLMDEMASIRAEINKKSVDFLLEVKKILTPEQLQKFWLPGQVSGWKMRHAPRPCPW